MLLYLYIYLVKGNEDGVVKLQNNKRIIKHFLRPNNGYSVNVTSTSVILLLFIHLYSIDTILN